VVLPGHGANEDAGIGVVLVVAFLLWTHDRRLRKQRERLRKTYQLGEEILGASSTDTILERITEGKSGPQDLELLKRLTGMVKAASLCGLGQTAPNPTLTTLRYFMDEYRAHIEEGRCPAGICHPAKVEAEVSA